MTTKKVVPMNDELKKQLPKEKLTEPCPVKLFNNVVDAVATAALSRRPQLMAAALSQITDPNMHLTHEESVAVLKITQELIVQLEEKENQNQLRAMNERILTLMEKYRSLVPGMITNAFDEITEKLCEPLPKGV
jgi:hypothetical protein